MRVKRTFLLLLATFFAGTFLGVAYAYLQPERAGEYVMKLAKEIGGLPDNPFDNFLMIFTHNAGVSLFVLVSGLFFGLGPWVMILFNGLVVGIVAGFLVEVGTPATKVILGLVPHGIVEIPAFVLAGTAGIVWYRSIREAKEPARGFKEGMKRALRLYAVTVGMLLIAAFIEAYVTPKVAGL
ncbi:stage II sporulation protein M [Thermococcus henrietii]|uniref:stage II sporulation protein M n=1 Tax=Thermococcus henrietii TaxID=2016361 RepID=UPI001CB79769|nr:stage II sporulation protein M [Thermococcus henrietii]